MNITAESEELSLSLLQEQIEKCVEQYEKSKSKVERKKLRKQYKELTNTYHIWVNRKVWKEKL